MGRGVRLDAQRWIDDEDGVEMVRHDGVFVQFNFGADLRGSQPFDFNDVTEGVQVHLTVNNFTKEGFAFVCANGNEINTLGGIIVSSQADGAAVENGLVRHDSQLSRFQNDIWEGRCL